MLFCSLEKKKKKGGGLTPKIRLLRFVIINSVLFNVFVCLDNITLIVSELFSLGYGAAPCIDHWATCCSVPLQQTPPQRYHVAFGVRSLPLKS